MLLEQASMMSQYIALFLFQAQSSPFTMLVPMVLVFVLFYFLMIVPQRKRQRAIDEMLNNLKPNDKAVTSGGIYGTVLSVPDNHPTPPSHTSTTPRPTVTISPPATPR